jgi:hypothetical protein
MATFFAAQGHNGRGLGPILATRFGWAACHAVDGAGGLARGRPETAGAGRRFLFGA